MAKTEDRFAALQEHPEIFGRRRWGVYWRNGCWRAYGQRLGTFAEMRGILTHGVHALSPRKRARVRVVLFPRKFTWSMREHGAVKGTFMLVVPAAVFRRSDLPALKRCHAGASV